MAEQLPLHSPLGGSGTYRWMKCPGSVRIGHGAEDSESDHAALGTAAHAVAAYCLSGDFDAWSLIGHRVDGAAETFYPPKFAKSAPESVHLIDKDMADAVQVYLDAVRSEYPDMNQGNTWVERSFHCPQIHPLMYGRGDLSHLQLAWRRLHVRDYKHGVGIVVEVEHNPQLMYYAVGLLTDLDLWDKVDEVVLWVDQPRGFHFDGPTRSWVVSTEELEDWCDEVLVPAMKLAGEVSRDPSLSIDQLMQLGFVVSGEHCRFCPARFLDCPKLRADMERMKEMVEEMEAAGGAPKMTNEWIGEFLGLFELAKIKQNAAREVGFVRAQDGHQIKGWKLAKAKAFRQWKEDAAEAAKKAFGSRAMEPAKLKSPAQMEKLPDGKAFAAEHAFKPDTGLQLVLDSDSRPEAGPKGRSMFKPVKKGGKK